MKKTNFFYASAIMMACAFGIQSCTVEDNPSGSYNPAKTVYVYDFAAAFNAGENPGNFNGNQNNGQGFYGWEKADKTDSKRNDYKGYTWAAGSVLPEICHVWRRSDRINGNIKEGGLYCPNEREMAIDGLQAGSTVQIFYEAPELTAKTSLKELPFGTWSAWVNGELTTPSDPDWNEGVSSGQPYGDGSVNRYADLSAYSKLVVTVTEGTPRFLFNRDVNDGQWSENEAESHLIDNTKGGWSSKYFSSEEKDGVTTWTVDLALMVKEKGYAHLHAIKGANWANCTATSMVVEGFPYEDRMVWAIGDGTSGNNSEVRATAELEGINSVLITGQTEIPSGAKILVKSVTPAEKGTGYIVVKVKKYMVITKIIIDDAVAE
jgi:hypothetical protein